MMAQPAKSRLWSTLSNAGGFTLVEVLVALAIASVVAWAILNLQVSHTKTAAVQAEVVAMQQGLRGSMNLLTRELKKAGYNPLGTAGAGIVTANATFIYYTSDHDNNGNGNGTLTGATEHAAFCFANNTLRFTEGNSNAVGNHASHAHLDVMADVEAVQFYYQLADDSWTLTPGVPGNIRVIQVTLLGRTRTADPNYKNTTVYDTPSGAKWGPYNDGFRRQLMTSTVKLWNM